MTEQELRDFIRKNLSIQVFTSKDPDYYGNYSLDITAKLVLLDENDKPEVVAEDTAHEWFSN